jgi:hypothetical protein
MDQFHQKQTPEAPERRNASGSPNGESHRRLLRTDQNHETALNYPIASTKIKSKM